MKLIKKYLNSDGPISTPTREDFIANKIQELIKQAYQRSIDRTLPELVGKTFIKYPLSYLDDLKDTIKRLLQELKNNSDESNKKYVRSVINGYLELIKSGGYWNDSPFNCLWTALADYGKLYRVAGNLLFRKNPGKYGFKEIPLSDLLQGDLILYGIVPGHGAIYNETINGKTYANYSDGEDVYKKHAYYGKEPTYAYRFVGTQQDLDNWNKEYDELYGVPTNAKGGRVKLCSKYNN